MVTILYHNVEPIWCIDDERGRIEWRRGTGDNVELMYLRCTDSRKGYGTALFREILIELTKHPPYHTVYGFTRFSNVPARNFYTKMGFLLTPVQGVYADGIAVVFSRSYHSLLLHHQLGHLLSPEKVQALYGNRTYQGSL